MFPGAPPHQGFGHHRPRCASLPHLYHVTHHGVTASTFLFVPWLSWDEPHTLSPSVGRPPLPPPAFDFHDLPTSEAGTWGARQAQHLGFVPHPCGLPAEVGSSDGAPPGLLPPTRGGASPAVPSPLPLLSPCRFQSVEVCAVGGFVPSCLRNACTAPPPPPAPLIYCDEDGRLPPKPTSGPTSDRPICCNPAPHGTPLVVWLHWLRFFRLWCTACDLTGGSHVNARGMARLPLSKHDLSQPWSLLFCRRRRHPATRPSGQQRWGSVHTHTHSLSLSLSLSLSSLVMAVLVPRIMGVMSACHYCAQCRCQCHCVDSAPLEKRNLRFSHVPWQCPKTRGGHRPCQARY